MKPNRDAAALAATLSNAAAASLPLPEQQQKPNVAAPKAAEVEPLEPPKAPLPPSGQKMKAMADTVAISLRPRKSTLERYTHAAADRTKKEGRVISAQQLMLEILETGPKVEK